MGIMGNAINQIKTILTDQVQTGKIPTSQIPITPDNEKYKVIMDVLDSKVGERLMNKIDPPQQNSNAFASLFDPLELQKRMVKGFFSDLDMADEMRTKMRGALQSKAITRTIKDSINTVIKQEEVQHGA